MSLQKADIVTCAPINVFPQTGWRGYPGDMTAKTVTALGNLTDNFGIGAGP